MRYKIIMKYGYCGFVVTENGAMNINSTEIGTVEFVGHERCIETINELADLLRVERIKKISEAVKDEEMAKTIGAMLGTIWVQVYARHDLGASFPDRR